MKLPFVAAILRALERYEAFRPFTEGEAWNIFRIAALGEAVGWTVLIIGIAIEHWHLPGAAYAVPIAGRIHGTIFMVYFAAVLIMYSSLRWPRWKLLVAIVAGVPPYGTFVYEQWASRHRTNTRARAQYRTILLWRLRARA